VKHPRPRGAESSETRKIEYTMTRGGDSVFEQDQGIDTNEGKVLHRYHIEGTANVLRQIEGWMLILFQTSGDWGDTEK